MNGFKEVSGNIRMALGSWVKQGEMLTLDIYLSDFEQSKIDVFPTDFIEPGWGNDEEFSF